MRKLYTLFSLCIGIALLNGCRSIDLPKGTSKGYSSYRIYKHSPDHVPDFSNREDLANELIQTALKREFNKNGLKESPQDAELVVAFLLIIQDTATSIAIHDYYINSGDEILSAAHQRMLKKSKKDRYYIDFVGDYEVGSLIVDIIDKQTGNLIYRDYVTREIIDSLSKEERQKRIAEAVAEATAAFFHK